MRWAMRKPRQFRKSTMEPMEMTMGNFTSFAERKTLGSTKLRGQSTMAARSWISTSLLARARVSGERL